MYQLLVRLSVTRECSWDQMYHRKIRGRFGQTLKRAGINRYQDSSQAPFTFSDLYPVDDEYPVDTLESGDDVRVLVASTDVDVLKAIAEGLQERVEVTAGSMMFEARAATPLETDVGEVGDCGTITTASGVVVTLEDGPERAAPPTYWGDRDHTPEQFKSAFHDNVSRVLSHETDVATPDMRLFDEYSHRKSYVVDVDVTPRTEISLLASKWDLHYEIRDERHQRQLNALLGTGAGARRSYGFGALQTRHDGSSSLEVGE